MTDSNPSTDRRRRGTGVAALACAGALALALGACGSSGNDDNAGDGAGTPAGSSTTSAGYNSGLPSNSQKKGGTLRLLSAEAFQHPDPGQAYFQLDYMFVYAVHRPLYYYEPSNSAEPIPDLADGEPRSRRTARP
jgi:hypothetical protein